MKNRFHINRRKFVGRLALGVGSLVLCTILLPRAGQLVNPDGSKEYHVSVAGIDTNPGTISLPFLIDHNFFLSTNSLNDISHGGAYAHNLFAGRVIAWPNTRITPYHKAHSTEIAGMETFPGGDMRFYNNIFLSQKKPVPWPERIPEELNNQAYFGLATYNKVNLPVYMSGNVFLGGAEPSLHEENPLVQPGFNPGVELEERSDAWFIRMRFHRKWAGHEGSLVRSEMLGKAKIPDLPYEDPEGNPYQLERDYFGNDRHLAHPYPGPLNEQQEGEQVLRVWPKKGH